jgi:drug/metabolite transporter (DMT)-like permease
MRWFLTSPLGLLLATGTMLGLGLPLGKLAVAAGVWPPAWAFLISLGAGGILLVAFLASGKRFRRDGHMLRYHLVTAIVSYAIPNLLVVSVVPHLGAGYTGIMFTLSPVATLSLSVLFNLRKPSRLGVAGIGVGFAGAMLVAVTRGEAGQPAEPLWVVLGLLIPVALATGNIYRTYDWPEGADPIELAVGSHLAAATLLLVAILALGHGASIVHLIDVPLLSAAQAAAAACMFVFYFRLQAAGGPVYLSQIGYVGAAVGLIAGTLFLGERYALLTWVGAAVVVGGVAMTTRAQARRET